MSILKKNNNTLPKFDKAFEQTTIDGTIGQMGSGKPTNNNINQGKSVLESYQEQANNLLNEKNNLNKDSLYETKNDALNSKLSSTNALLDQYKQNQQAFQSSKVQSQLAQQNANTAMNQYLKYAGLAGQGISESMMAQSNNNYVNNLSNLNAQKNSDNSSAQQNYLSVLQKIEEQKQSGIKEMQTLNAEKMLANIESTIDEEGKYDYGRVKNYKLDADKLYKSGEITKFDYDMILEIYNKAVLMEFGNLFSKNK